MQSRGLELRTPARVGVPCPPLRYGGWAKDKAEINPFIEKAAAAAGAEGAGAPRMSMADPQAPRLSMAEPQDGGPRRSVADHA